MSLLLVASPVAAFDSDLAPFLEKKIPSDPEAAVPAVKPVPANAPFPQLPPVEAMLNVSTHTVNEIEKEVTKIQARVHSVEQQDQAKLAMKKAEFESQLKSQEEETRDVIAENAQIVARITALQTGNQVLRETSKQLQGENQGMRAELRSAATKVSAAGDFIKASEKSTDDRHAKVLAVLSEGVKHPRRQSDAPVPVSTDSESEDAAENQETADNEDAASSTGDSSDAVVDSPQKATSAEEKPKGLVHIFGHRSKASRQAAHEAKDGEKKKEDDDDDEDADDDKEDDKDDNKDDAAESFMQYMSRRVHTEEGESEEAEASESEENGVDTTDMPFVNHHHGFHHKNKDSSDVAVDGASKSMLQAVSQELKDLAAEDEQGVERQTQMFHSALAGEHRAYKAALAQQRALNKTEASLLNLQSKLRRAVAHLQETKAHLQQRVRGLGQYLQHAAHLLLAPDKEAAKLLEAMDVPVPVTMPEQNAAPAVTQATSLVSTGIASFQPLAIQAVKK